MGADPGSPDRFEWTTEQVQLTIWLEADEWWIQQTMPNPLLGPKVTSKASHKQAKQAAWDVLSRVSKATRDNEEGVRVASSAARWMRQIGEARTISYCD